MVLILSFFILINVSIQMSLFLANSYGNLINTHKFCLLRISGKVSDILPMVYFSSSICFSFSVKVAGEAKQNVAKQKVASNFKTP